ncbi:MAG: cation-transporting P-type ATPase [Bacteroides sp.]|jgi:Ca2+-transporting ATPase|nr:cation-transporting P-type ATPase [Bacteroides sp.]
MNDLHPYAAKIDDICASLETDHREGLSSREAKKRLKQKGPNKLQEKKERSIWKLLFDQFKSVVIYLLIAALVVSLILGDFPEAMAIFVVIILNMAIGFYMELQARNSMKALRQMDKLTCVVLRSGEKEEIDAERLVPGDLILIDSGQLIPADARIIEHSELQINESALTGESFSVDKQTDPLDKDTPLADRTNMVFKGTSVTMGNARAVVTGTGMNTEIGHISEMVSSEEREEIPLNIKLNKLSKRLVWIVLGMAATYAVLGYFTGKEPYIIAQTAIAWAIAAIPEGLAIVATIALAKGMIRLAHEHVIVKRLAAVETLGETTTILTDKTGTLTESKLTAEHINTPCYQGKAKKVIEDMPGDNECLEKLITVSALCNNVEINDEGEVKGDTLETSLYHFVEKIAEGRFHEIRQKYERVDEDPFDSEDKYMITMHKDDSGYFFALKGAADSVLDECDQVLSDKGEESLSEEAKKKWSETDDEMAANGLRTIAFAFKKSKDKGAFEGGYTLIGFIGFLDPPRLAVKDSIKTCRDAGIRVVMVTGDHPETSKNIAKQVGIADDEDPIAFTGKDMRNMGREEEKKFYEANIFARVSPGQKLDILKIFKDAGDIVGMTGDGVNDAPALKKADIGIAMGKRGTQVAKEVSDMILKDDSFSSIVTAIREGRIIFSNIRKFIEYQLSYHLSEIVVIAVVSFTVFNLALLPLQLLFLNLLVDVFPALALGVSKGMPGVMHQPPKDPDEPILTKTSWWIISSYGVIIALWVTGAYFAGLFYLDVSNEIANNIAFFSLALTQLLNVFNMRNSEEPVFRNQVTRNKWVWYAISLCGVVIFAAYFSPRINTLLSFQPMGLKPWILVAVTIVLANTSIQLLKHWRVLK